jgi:hypothetical protein
MTTILVDNCDVIIAEMNLRGSRCQSVCRLLQPRLLWSMSTLERTQRTLPAICFPTARRVQKQNPPHALSRPPAREIQSRPHGRKQRLSTRTRRNLERQKEMRELIEILEVDLRAQPKAPRPSGALKAVARGSSCKLLFEETS